MANSTGSHSSASSTGSTAEQNGSSDTMLSSCSVKSEKRKPAPLLKKPSPFALCTRASVSAAFRQSMSAGISPSATPAITSQLSPSITAKSSRALCASMTRRVSSAAACSSVMPP